MGEEGRRGERYTLVSRGEGEGEEGHPLWYGGRGGGDGRVNVLSVFAVENRMLLVFHLICFRCCNFVLV